MILDAENIEAEIAKSIYMANHRPPARIWENASSDVRAWAFRQGRAALKRLEELGVVEKELTRVR
jgi:hypothetical protein